MTRNVFLEEAGSGHKASDSRERVKKRRDTVFRYSEY